jgi:gamma-glutamyltranspeptidase/glutathione hydrolase
MSASDALRAPRLHDQIQPNITYLERKSIAQGITVDGHSEGLAEGLRKKGHVVDWVTGECETRLELILGHRSTPCAMKFLPDGKWEAAGDPRKNESGGCVHYA